MRRRQNSHGKDAQAERRSAGPGNGKAISLSGGCSLSTSPPGAACSQACTALPGGCSMVSGDRLSLLTQGFSAPPSFRLARGPHSDPVSTLPLAQLLTVNWPNGPIPNSQERNVIEQLWSGAPCLGQSALSRECHVSHEAWAEGGL